MRWRRSYEWRLYGWLAYAEETRPWEPDTKSYHLTSTYSTLCFTHVCTLDFKKKRKKVLLHFYIIFFLPSQKLTSSIVYSHSNLNFCLAWYMPRISAIRGKSKTINRGLEKGLSSSEFWIPCQGPGFSSSSSMWWLLSARQHSKTLSQNKNKKTHHYHHQQKKNKRKRKKTP